MTFGFSAHAVNFPFRSTRRNVSLGFPAKPSPGKRTESEKLAQGPGNVAAVFVTCVEANFSPRRQALIPIRIGLTQMFAHHSLQNVLYVAVNVSGLLENRKRLQRLPAAGAFNAVAVMWQEKRPMRAALDGFSPHPGSDRFPAQYLGEDGD